MGFATAFDKLWDINTVDILKDGRTLLHVDRHLLHEVTSPRAFEALERSGHGVMRPKLTVAVEDHIVSSAAGRSVRSYPPAVEFIETLRRNTSAAGIPLIRLDDPRQGIVHVIAAELGIALPGASILCGDSHTCTLGGLGALAFGIGTKGVEEVLRTQMLAVHKPRRMRITVDGKLRSGVFAKDVALYAVGVVGTQTGNGYAVEFAGEAIREMDVDARFTLCNMSVEMGSRIGFVAPDEKTFSYLAGRPCAPRGTEWTQAVSSWKLLASDADAAFDMEFSIQAPEIEPQVTWGTSPDQTIGIRTPLPDPAGIAVSSKRDAVRAALDYMGLAPGMRLEGVGVDYAFIGSCNGSRLPDLRSAAQVVRGHKVAKGVRAIIVPGSMAIRRQAEAEGLDTVFREAGFEWRESACSMCAAVNGDLVEPGKRCISASNRNFQGRQGPGARTHLASPAMVAAAAIAGSIIHPEQLN